MKNLRIVIVLLAFGLFSFASSAQSNVAGNWIAGKENTVIKIAQEGSSYSGKIISSENPKAKAGSLMIKDLKQDKKGNWKGQVYAPKRDEWYDAEFTPKGNILEIEISVGFFSKTMEWKKQ